MKFESKNSTRSSLRFENSTRLEFEKKWFGASDPCVRLSPRAAAVVEYIKVVALAVVTSYVMGVLLVTCADMESVTPNLIVVIFGLVFFAGIFFLQ